MRCDRTEPADLIVIGGGIHGCAVARDASLRGLRVILVERDDLAAATSSASSKLAHGGLRYLAQGRLGLVREGLRERGQLLRNAPHLVRPLPFLLPVYEDGPWGRWMLRLGLGLYDLFGRTSSLGRHRWLSREQCLQSEPTLRQEKLQGAFFFMDAQVDDARLCLENALDAQMHGAQILTRCEAVGLIAEGGTICGVRVRDAEGLRELHCRSVVNCAGPWVARVSDGQDLASRVRLRFSRGSHIVLPRRTQGHALLLHAPEDGRVVFAMPYKGRTLVGTTEIEMRSPTDELEPSAEEVRYLLECSRHYFPEAQATEEDILFRFAGQRTLPGDSHDAVGRVSREAVLQEDAPGLLTLVGGKLTTHRATAEEIVDRLANRVERSLPPSDTLHRAYPGAGGPAMNEYFAVAEDLLLKKYSFADLGILRHLLGVYGSRHVEILQHFDRDPRCARRIEERFPFTQGEIHFLVEREWARSVEDLVRRRTYRLFLGTFDAAAHSAWQRALDSAKAHLAQVL